MNTPCPANEGTSSAELSNLTGNFLNYLNKHVLADGMLKGFEWILDSANPGTSETTSQALLPLLRPDFQLFVRNVLILRWENKIDKADLGEVMEENVLKLKVWSPLYYGMLPYVIGGCCAGRQFRWLKLSPSGKNIVPKFISDVYDLNILTDVASFLHSTIWMHCLLQKLEGQLTDHIPLILYKPLLHSSGGEAAVYPDFVHGVVRPPLDTDKFQPLCDSITCSMYLINQKHF